MPNRHFRALLPAGSVSINFHHQQRARRFLIEVDTFRNMCGCVASMCACACGCASDGVKRRTGDDRKSSPLHAFVCDLNSGTPAARWQIKALNAQVLKVQRWYCASRCWCCLPIAESVHGFFDDVVACLLRRDAWGPGCRVVHVQRLRCSASPSRMWAWSLCGAPSSLRSRPVLASLLPPLLETPAVAIGTATARCCLDSDVKCTTVLVPLASTSVV